MPGDHIHILEAMDLAGGACEALDHMDVNGMVGTLAGENTVFVVMKDNACAETFCQEIREML